MRKLRNIVAAMLLVAGLIPAVALAHDGTNSGDNQGFHFGGLFEQIGIRMHTVTGTVTSVGSSSFDIKTASGNTITVDVGTNTVIEHPFSNKIALSDIKVGDKVQVKGSGGIVVGDKDNDNDNDDVTPATATATNTINALVVLDMPANTHPAKGKGTVTAVNGNSLTLQTNHDGIISNVTVNTTANTQVTKSDGTAGTTADVTVGSKISVKGLWDEILNVLNAIKIHLF